MKGNFKYFNRVASYTFLALGFTCFLVASDDSLSYDMRYSLLGIGLIFFVLSVFFDLGLTGIFDLNDKRLYLKLMKFERSIPIESIKEVYYEPFTRSSRYARIYYLRLVVITDEKIYRIYHKMNIANKIRNISNSPDITISQDEVLVTLYNYIISLRPDLKNKLTMRI